MSVPYSETVLERFRHPRYLGEIPAADGSAETFNPLCGDRLRLEVRVAPGAPVVVEAVRYRGDACAIALAAADVLAEMVEGQPVTDAVHVDEIALAAALGGAVRPSRRRCMTLGLEALRGALAACEAGRP